MASSIIQLSDQLISQIAAGEVIESPASVVKELVENAVDAGAKNITIAIKGGGLGLIQVSDDGLGMDEKDLPLAVQRHATSKLKSFLDLEELLTLGFRGEALSSIAAVSKIKILSSKGEQTKEGQIKEGRAFVLKALGSKDLTIEPSVRVRGTTIEVSSLFYNVPVRKKFQRSLSSLNAQIMRTVQNLALAHPQFGFTLFIEEKQVFKTRHEKLSFEEAFKKATEAVLGSSQNYRWIDFKENRFQLLGYISEPLSAKKNRLSQRLVVNGRPIFSNLASRAVKEGYATALAEDLFPAFILHLKIHPSLIDVNVHPQKKEVRFKEELFLKERIKKAIFSSFQTETTLSAAGEMLSQEANALSFFQKNTFDETYEKLQRKPQNNFKDFTANYLNNSHVLSPSDLKIGEAKALSSAEQMSFSEKKAGFTAYALLGSYYFMEAWPFQKEGIAVVDLKAVSASLLFQTAVKNIRATTSAEEKKDRGQKQGESQRLLLPKLIELSVEEMLEIEAKASLFQELGLEVRKVGTKTIAIDTLPLFIEEARLEEFFLKVFEELKSFGQSQQTETFWQKKLARLTSSFAQRRQTPFSLEEARSLMKKFFQTERIAFSPLGEKIAIFLDKKELEGLFQKK